MDSTIMTTDTALSLGHGTADAIAKSSTIWAAGCHALSQAMGESVRARMEDNAANWKAMCAITSPQEAMKLQASLAHGAFDRALADVQRLTRASMKLVEDAMVPFKEQMTARQTTVLAPGIT